MALVPGTRLGVYEVVAQIGEGGMGQVYRATDTKLKRQVAIKVLPPSLAVDADRLARFQREAEVLASLNHPNIAGIYGLEESPSASSGQAGVTALVMELVEGDDLSQRIARGAMPIDEALPIAKQIADALEAAHEQGIVHRDLKPANIKVRADGTVKVLDFGLAKAIEAGGAGQAGGAGRESLSMSPTITTPAMPFDWRSGHPEQGRGVTQAGMILGTAAYMAPEQARGKTVDRRADIWAFGAVVFEMLTGRRAFGGEDISLTLAFVMTKEPEWAALPPSTTSGLRGLLRRCLEKDPKRRLQAIGEARLRLEDLISGAPEPVDAPRLPTTDSRLPTRATALPWGIAGATVIVAGALLTLWAPWRPAREPASRTLLASIGADASLPTDQGASAVLSPDGTTLVFSAQQAGQRRLFVRKLDQLQAVALAGTEGAANPFFSPDGQSLAFFTPGKLKKVSVTGGAAVTLCEAPNGRGGTWADDGTIVFTPSGNSNTTLMRVPAAGGTATAFGALSNGATTQRWPQALPGGKAVLYTEHSETNGFDNANLVVAALSPASGGTPKVVVRAGHYGRYVPSGHLIYMQQGTLFAVRFDLNRLETIGPAVPALEGISANPGVTGGAQWAVSTEGTLVYVPGTVTTTANPIEWIARDGKTSPLRAAKADWAAPSFSPDGQKVAIQISDGKQNDIWVYDWARDTLTQLTFDPGQDLSPAWTPDGRRIVFASDRAKAGVGNLYWVNADGTGDVTRLTESSDNQIFPSWHPSGRFLAFSANHASTGLDLMILPMEGDAARGLTAGKPTVFLGTPASEVAPTFSPDGRWIAYHSNEVGGSGSNEVFVRPFPGPGGKWRVSTEGGFFPQWSATTHELLFLDALAQSKVMVAPYDVDGDSFRAGKPVVWSPIGIQRARVGNRGFDLHPDGKRIASLATQEQSAGVQDKVVFVFNFFDYLRKIAPGTK